MMTTIDAMGGDDRQLAKIEEDAPMDLVPIIQVEHPGDMWWSMPISEWREILAAAQQSNCNMVSWVWQWPKTKQGTYKLQGVSTGQS